MISILSEVAESMYTQLISYFRKETLTLKILWHL